MESWNPDRLSSQPLNRQVYFWFSLAPSISLYFSSSASLYLSSLSSLFGGRRSQAHYWQEGSDFWPPSGTTGAVIYLSWKISWRKINLCVYNNKIPPLNWSSCLLCYMRTRGANGCDGQQFSFLHPCARTRARERKRRGIGWEWERSESLPEYIYLLDYRIVHSSNFLVENSLYLSSLRKIEKAKAFVNSWDPAPPANGSYRLRPSVSVP